MADNKCNCSCGGPQTAVLKGRLNQGVDVNKVKKIVDEEIEKKQIDIFLGELVVTCTEDLRIVITRGEDEVIYDAIPENVPFIVKLPGYGVYTINEYEDGIETPVASKIVKVDTVKQYEVDLKYKKGSVYGVYWSGASTSKWSRTDDAKDFVDPVPYYKGMTEQYGSPFDNLYPWNGIQVVEDLDCGTVVKIPKFWYKMEQNGLSLSIQISDVDAEGFEVSPLHADKGDGFGERDYAYVGRYHCSSIDYRSRSGDMPKNGQNISVSRNNIKNLSQNSDVFQYDISAYWTIRLLYLVEFANWNSQECIGFGCGNNSGIEKVGKGDEMPYHTGTPYESRDTYGVGVQYRYIEGLWDNCEDWLDGEHGFYQYQSSYILCCDSNYNPENYDDFGIGGKIVNYIPNVQGGGYASSVIMDPTRQIKFGLFLNNVGGSQTTYITDVIQTSYSNNSQNYGAKLVVAAGAYYSSQESAITDSGRGAGMFSKKYIQSTSTSLRTGCRLIKLPKERD